MFLHIYVHSYTITLNPLTHCLFKHDNVISPVSPNTPHRRMIYSNHFISHIGLNFQIHIGNYMGKCGNPATRGCCYCYCLFLISFITYGVSQFIIVLPLHLLSHCMFNTPPPRFIIYLLPCPISCDADQLHHM